MDVRPIILTAGATGLAWLTAYAIAHERSAEEIADTAEANGAFEDSLHRAPDGASDVKNDL